MMLRASNGIRLVRSTRSPTGIVNTAPTSSATELSRPILVGPMRNACSTRGATAPPVDVSAPLSASTSANVTITRARAGPPTRLTTSPRSRRTAHWIARHRSRPKAPVALRRSRSGRSRPGDARRSGQLPLSVIARGRLIGELPAPHGYAQPQVADDPGDRGQPERDRAVGEHANHRTAGRNPERRERADHPALHAADPTGQRQQAPKRSDDVPYH